MSESSDPILSANVSIETRAAHQALQALGGEGDKGAGVLDRLSLSVDKVEGAAKRLGQTAGATAEQIGESNRVQSASVQTSEMSARAANQSSDSVAKLRAEWASATAELQRGIDKQKSQINTQKEYQHELAQSTKNVSEATVATAGLGSAAQSMVGTFLGLTGINSLLQNLVGNIDRAAEAAREAGKRGIQQQSSAQDVVNNLQLQGPAGMKQAQNMIQSVMSSARVSEEQAIGAIVGANDALFEPLSASGGKIVDMVAKFSGRNKVSNDAVRQLTKVMSDSGTNTPEGVEQFLARIETGFRTTPAKNMDQFLRSMFRGVSEQVSSQGADFWQTFSQYVGAVRSTGTEHQAATAIQQMFAATSGTGDPARKFLARSARLEGITNVALPTDAELRNHALTRETPEDEAVIAASDRMQGMDERADREREQYENKRTEILKPFSHRKMTVEKIREHDSKIDRELTALDNERVRKVADYERDYEKASDDASDARKKLAEKLVSDREVKAFVAAGPEARQAVFRSFLKTEEGRQRLMKGVGMDEQSRMAMTILRPEVQKGVGQTYAEIMSPGVVDAARQAQKMYEMTAPAQAAASSAKVYGTETAAGDPGSVAFSLLADEGQAEWNRRAARGEFDTFGDNVAPDRPAVPMIGTGQQSTGRPQRPIAAAYTEENQKIDVQVEMFLREITADYLAMSPEDRAKHPEIFQIQQEVQSLFAPRTQWEQVRSWSASYKKSALRRLVKMYADIKSKGTSGVGGAVGSTTPISAVQPPLPNAPTETDMKVVPVAPGGSSRGDFGLPDVSPAMAAQAAGATGARRTSGSPQVVNNVNIGTVISRGGDGLDFPAPLDRNASH